MSLSGAEEEEEKEEGGSDVLSSGHCDCQLSVDLSLSGRLSTRQHHLSRYSKAKNNKQPNFLTWHLALLQLSTSVQRVMAFTLSEIMAARRQQSQAQSHSQRGSRAAVEVDEYSTNPTQAFTFYNINQGRFQPPHVHMWVNRRKHTYKKKQKHRVLHFLFFFFKK